MTRHVVLLGDSIFDNAAYVGSGPAVITQLREAMPNERATLLAQDGACVDGVPRQIERAPEDATHFVISAGGNDALGQMGLLQEPMQPDPGAVFLMRLHGIQQEFAEEYRPAVSAALARDLPTLLCTIYHPRFDSQLEQSAACAALALFNEVIIETARDHRLPVLDLRAVCDRDEHYANPIEPSSAGGERIVASILAALGTHSFDQPICAIHGPAGL